MLFGLAGFVAFFVSAFVRLLVRLDCSDDWREEDLRLLEGADMVGERRRRRRKKRRGFMVLGREGLVEGGGGVTQRGAGALHNIGIAVWAR